MQTPFTVCTPSDAPLTVAEREFYITRPPAWQQGVEGKERPMEPGADSVVVGLILAVAVLVGLNMRYVRRILRSLPQDLVSVRRRANAFDDHTANESRVILLLLVQLFVLGGVLTFVWLLPDFTISRLSASAMGKTVGALALLNAGFYLFQLAACEMVGYVFTDTINSVLWRRGLNSSQALLSLSLLLPALVSIFYPLVAHAMVLTAASLYVASRIFYVVKGFRIFYTNFASLLYFILYLCSLEIIPVIFYIVLARKICEFII